ncbi:MAG: FAD-dependent oxidoreductase [Endomicrobiia bacterium]
MNVLDLVIIGAGPAGITASIYAARKKLNFTVITKDIGGQAVLSWDIENYTGYQFITGPDLAIRFREHLEKFDIQLKEQETVLEITKQNNIFKTKTNNSEYLSKTVLICSGRIPKKLNVEGEEEFKYKGLTYCATCDGPLFKNKEVIVVGGGNSGFDALLQLAKIASKVYLLEATNKLLADPIMIEKANQFKNVEIYTNSRITKIYGEKTVSGVKCVINNQETEIKVQGIFVEIGSIASSDFIKDVDKNEFGEIIVNCRCETSVNGIYAAGDVTTVPAKQIIVACGEGAKALISLSEYLNTLK